jgi:hypothetical protein
MYLLPGYHSGKPFMLQGSMQYVGMKDKEKNMVVLKKVDLATHDKKLNPAILPQLTFSTFAWFAFY